MDTIEPTESTISNDTKCVDCGALLKFAPGTNHLTCDYCGAANEIAAAKNTVVLERDFNSFLKLSTSKEDLKEVHTVKCDGCGAQTTFKPNTVSDDCAFCGTSLVIENSSRQAIIKPESILPFKVDQKSAFGHFGKWIKGLWFVPNDLKKYANNIEKLKGVYIPYWTYDCRTISNYTGEQGINRREIEHYTEEVNGRTVSKTRTVTVTDWYPAAGKVNCYFDDMLTIASNSLPENYARKLEPWDLKNLIPFDEKYLSGFVTESYQIGLKEGFEKVKPRTEQTIRSTIIKDIGGDDQKIISVDTDYHNIKFKHTLLPIWISAYRYKGKVYRLMINGRTGEVQGERPYSWVKITLTIVGVVAAIGAVFVLFG